MVEEPSGDILIFPKGDTTAAPSGRMPPGSAFFDTIVRQPPFDESDLDPADNLEEFGPISDADLDHLARSVEWASSTGRGGRRHLRRHGFRRYRPCARAPS